MPQSNRANYTRDVAVAVAMAVLLAASVAGAWWLTWAMNDEARNGAAIVRTLRQEGLGEYWEGPERQIWQITGADGPGWKVSLRRRMESGGFEGISAVFVASSRTIDWEHWTLNADATEGVYVAGFVERPLPRQPENPVVPTTRIEMAGGRLVVRQFLNNNAKAVTSTAATPEHYAPEGTLRLLRRMVAMNEADADFAVVFNDAPPAGEEPDFKTLRYRYSGQRQVNGRTVRSVETSMTLRDQNMNQFIQVQEFLIDPQQGELQQETTIFDLQGRGRVMSRMELVTSPRIPPQSAAAVKSLLDVMRRVAETAGMKMAPAEEGQGEGDADTPAEPEDPR